MCDYVLQNTQFEKKKELIKSFQISTFAVFSQALVGSVMLCFNKAFILIFNKF